MLQIDYLFVWQVFAVFVLSISIISLTIIIIIIVIAIIVRKLQVFRNSAGYFGVTCSYFYELMAINLKCISVCLRADHFSQLSIKSIADVKHIWSK